MKKIVFSLLSATVFLGFVSCSKTYYPKAVKILNQNGKKENLMMYSFKNVEKYNKDGIIISQKGFFGDFDSNLYPVSKNYSYENIWDDVKNNPEDTAYFLRTKGKKDTIEYLYANSSGYSYEDMNPTNKVQLISIKHGDPSPGKPYSITDFYYDTEGNNIRKTKISVGFGYTYHDKVDYSFDSKNNLIHEIVSQAKGSFPTEDDWKMTEEYIYENKYDSNDNLVYQKKMNRNGEALSEDFYVYDMNNMMIQHRCITDLTIHNLKAAFKNVNYKNQINENEDYFFTPNNNHYYYSPFILDESFKYDEKGNLTERVIEFDHGPDENKLFFTKLEEKYSYKYHSNGNLKSRVKNMQWYFVKGNTLYRRELTPINLNVIE